MNLATLFASHFRDYYPGLGAATGYSAPAPSDELVAMARELYARMPQGDDKRLAWWAFKRHGTLLAEVAPPAKAERFVLGDEPDDPDCVFAGYDTGERWNGWAVPMFERAELERVAACRRGPAGTPQCCDAYTIALVGSELVETHDPATCQDTVVIEPDLVLTEDGERTVWSLGMGLTFAVLAEDEES